MTSSRGPLQCLDAIDNFPKCLFEASRERKGALEREKRDLNL